MSEVEELLQKDSKTIMRSIIQRIATGPELSKDITLPSEAIDDFGLFAEDSGGVAPSPNPFRLVEYGNAFEAEPNNELSQATKAELPLALNGIIQDEGEVDCFRFADQNAQVS